MKNIYDYQEILEITNTIMMNNQTVYINYKYKMI